MADDLPDRTGRQIAALGGLVERAANRALPAKAHPGNTDNGQGRYLTSTGGNQFWVGLWYPAWGAHGQSPIWAATEPAATTRETFRRSLAKATDLPAAVYGKWVGVPLYLKPGEEALDAEERLEADIVAFAQALDTIGIMTTVEAE